MLVWGQGGHNLPHPVLPPPVLFCPFVSRLLPFIVFLPLSCKSCCLTPYSNRECFGPLIEAAFLRHKFTLRSKILSVLWTIVVRSNLLRRSSMEGFFPTTPKTLRPIKNGLWRHFIWLALLSLRRISTASETDKTLTQLTHVYMCHAISFMSHLEKFPISQEVMLFFLILELRLFVFWLFSHIKFCFKPRRTLNGSQETLLGSFLWLDVSSNKYWKLAFLNFSPAFPHRRDPASRPFFSHLPYPSSPLFSRAPAPPPRMLRCPQLATLC